MASYRVHGPSALERVLFDAGLVQWVSLAQVYDVKAGTSAQRSSIDPRVYRVPPDVHDPEGWANEVWATARWEWFAYVLRDCRRVLDVGCGEGRPSLYLSHYVPEGVTPGVPLPGRPTGSRFSRGRLAPRPPFSGAPPGPPSSRRGNGPRRWPRSSLYQLQRLDINASAAACYEVAVLVSHASAGSTACERR
ncbi:MAG: class I SAM-dependent methyltransferase [Candidatus Latescibacterota bacterium]